MVVVVVVVVGDVYTFRIDMERFSEFSIHRVGFIANGWRILTLFLIIVGFKTCFGLELGQLARSFLVGELNSPLMVVVVVVVLGGKEGSFPRRRRDNRFVFDSWHQRSSFLTVDLELLS